MTSYEELVERRAALPYSMPTAANRLTAFADRAEEVALHAAGVRPILHEAVVPLIRDILEIKRAHGSAVERALYADMDAVDFVSRVFARRPLAFLNSNDTYLLRGGARGTGGFDAIGTDAERAPLTLERLLSYDEMSISALMGVSVPTHFINSGGRENRAVPGAAGSFEARGVYTGLVGTRFEREERMESRQVLVTASQNTPAKGYGPGAAAPLLEAWARFYGLDAFPTYAEASADASGRYLRLGPETLFDAEIYRRRLRLSIEPFLMDANRRAEAAGTRAYVHAVGLGLGVWAVDPRQTALMVDVYGAVLAETPLPHVADLDFSWFRGVRDCAGVSDGEVFSRGGNAITIHLSQRDPAAPLAGANKGKLLVAMYAWDSNSFPGNEYWLGALSASGDPAAACCSMIPELQNPEVNLRVSGAHALVFGPSGVTSLRD